jgi:aspartate racemase
VSGRRPALPELPIQYADFAVWQRQWLPGSTLDAQLAYWKRQLADLPVSDLPTDYARPAAAEGRGAICVFVLPRELVESLRVLSQRAEVTLFMTLVAALHVLLYWYSGQEDVALGSGVANRHQVETEGLIGFFVNVIVLRSRLSGNPTFRELLDRVRPVCLEAYAHQDLPFEKLVEELQVGRELSRNPFYQLTFALQNTPMPTLDIADLRLTAMDVDPGTARSDLVLNMLETPEGLRCALRYRSDLFSADTMTRLSGGLAAILQEVAARPEVKLESLIDRVTALDGDHRIKKAESLAEIRRQKFISTRRRAIGRP